MDKLKLAVLGNMAAMCGVAGIAPVSVNDAFQQLRKFFTFEDDKKLMNRCEDRVLDFQQRMAEWESFNNSQGEAA